VSIFDSYPADWMNHYRSQGYLRIDPTVRAGMQHADLIVWPDTLDTHDSDHTSGLWSDAHDSGLNVGIAQGSWSAHGAFGLLTLARPASSLTPVEIDWLRQPVYWLANLSHTTMTALLSPKRMPEVSVTLTEREREVLCWSGEGKTAYEVGIILSITERTVNFHIRNVLGKLSATNKIQALVKAIAMGLVYPV
jgi:LuxR family quorum-sensing system transcriptional regulator SolR